ncbi:MAG: DUF599 domain-containing protein [Rubrimonas sp.]|uniref:DUF599 domain-containing protein n=1 Tax=Rubrimonas sp. TaxID=2036015 RepID=UPI002FDE06E1
MIDAPALFDAFGPLDLAALALLFGGWARMEALVRPKPGKTPATAEIMARWRARWFAQTALRENRIMDAQLVGSLRSGVAFFISGALLALGGAIALIGQADRVASVAVDLAGAETAPSAIWTLKLLLVIAVLAVAFLHFVWSHRIFGYCEVMVGAIPPHDDPEAPRVAARAARMNVLAARSFNRGLRAIYFALAALAWLLGPVALALASALTLWMLYRREFLSDTRRAALED